MFKFQANFLQKPTTIISDVPTSDAAKTTTTTIGNHLKSRLLMERRAKKLANKPQNCTLAAGEPRHVRRNDGEPHLHVHGQVPNHGGRQRNHEL